MTSFETAVVALGYWEIRRLIAGARETARRERKSMQKRPFVPMVGHVDLRAARINDCDAAAEKLRAALEDRWPGRAATDDRDAKAKRAASQELQSV